MEQPQDEAADEYAIVEIFGHRRHVGRVTEVERYGTKMLRVDVPRDGDFANGVTTHLYGGAAIFGVTPTDLTTVLRLNRSSHPTGLYIGPPEPEEVEDYTQHGFFDDGNEEGSGP